MKKVLFLLLAVSFVATAAFAQSYDIKEMTPAVKSLLEARKARFAEVKALKAQGSIGENNRGYVEALGGGDAAKALALAENRDRKAVYLAIVDQNNLGAGALDTIESVFAGVQRDKAQPGEKIQDPAGNWMTK